MNQKLSTMVDEFLAEKAKQPSARGNLIFALDATMSREDTWDLAAHLQAQMFREVAAIGSLDVQLVYFRGEDETAEVKASGWVSDPLKLTHIMGGIKCRAGLTQIGRVLSHALREKSQRQINALVFVGDACEEFPSQLTAKARELGVPVFMIQEGHDDLAETAFRELARITKGAHLRFDAGSAKQLGELLRAVAMFAVGGAAALERQGSAAAKLLLGQIR